MTRTSTMNWPATLVLTTACGLSVPVLAEEGKASESSPDFGGPDAVENLIADDDRLTPAMISKRLYQPWFDWKASVTERTGISFGLDYSALYLASNNDAGQCQRLRRHGALLRLLGPGGAWHQEHRRPGVEGRAPPPLQRLLAQ